MVLYIDHHREEYQGLLIKQEVFSIMWKRIVQKLFTLLNSDMSASPEGRVSSSKSIDNQTYNSDLVVHCVDTFVELL